MHEIIYLQVPLLQDIVITGLQYSVGNRRAVSTHDLVLHGLVCFLAQSRLRFCIVPSIHVGARLYMEHLCRSLGKPPYRPALCLCFQGHRCVCCRLRCRVRDREQLQLYMLQFLAVNDRLYLSAAAREELIASHTRCDCGCYTLATTSPVPASISTDLSLVTTTGVGMTAFDTRGTAGAWSRY